MTAQFFARICLCITYYDGINQNGFLVIVTMQIFTMHSMTNICTLLDKKKGLKINYMRFHGSFIFSYVTVDTCKGEQELFLQN